VLIMSGRLLDGRALDPAYVYVAWWIVEPGTYVRAVGNVLTVNERGGSWACSGFLAPRTLVKFLRAEGAAGRLPSPLQVW
jgi:hypothetical protein